MSEGRTSQFMPWMTNSGWMYWPPKRLMILLSFLAAGITATILGVWWIGAIGAGICAILISPSPNNRNYVYQFLGEVRDNRREQKIQRRRGSRHSRELKDVMFDTDGEEARRLRLEPVQPQFIPLEGGKSGFLTEVNTPVNGRHTMWTVANGHGSAFAGDPEELVEAADSFSGVLKEVSREIGIGLFASLFFVRVPTDPEDAIAYFESKRFESLGSDESALQANYAEALSAQIDSSGGFHTGIGISLPRPRSWRSTPLDKLTSDQIRDADGYRITDLLKDRLAAIGVDGVCRPNPYEATVLLHGALDVAEVERLYRDWYVDRVRIREGSLKSFKDSLVMQAGALPENWSASHTHLRIGTTYHRMFFIPGYPDRHVEAGLMQYLFNCPADIWYGISTVYETVSAVKEQKRLRIQRNDQDARRLSQAEKGSSADEAQLDHEALTREANSLLYHSRGEAVKMNVLASVSATSIPALDVAEAELRKMFRDVNLAPKTVKGASLQARVKLAMLGIHTGKLS